MSCFIFDRNILWLQLEKSGSPPAWEANKNYKLGDIVVPTNPTPEQENMMFQCVGFVGSSNSTQPSFPIVEGQIVIDNEIIWKAKLQNSDPEELAKDEYYIISPEYEVT